MEDNGVLIYQGLLTWKRSQRLFKNRKSEQVGTIQMITLRT